MEVEGSRKNSVNYHNGDGFFYRKIRENVTKEGLVIYVRCCLDGCKGSGKIVTGGENRVVQVLNEHIRNGAVHGPDITLEHRRRLVSTMKRMAQESTTLKLRTLYDRECERDPLGAQTVTFNAVESTLYKQRRKIVPAIPRTLDALAEAMESPGIRQLYGTAQASDGSREPFFRLLLVGDGDDRTAVFASPTMCQFLKDAEEIHIDGTFKSVPQAAGLRQLVTIHVVVGDHTFPAVFALMTRKLAASYTLLLEAVKTVLAPGMAPKKIISDFEQGIMVGAQTVFPAASIVGCWFHFAQAIWKKIQSLGMVPMVREVEAAARLARKCMVLPLLPAFEIFEGFNNILTEADRLHLVDDFSMLFDYILNFWLGTIGTERISVHSQKKRTNNNVESFHATLLNRIGQVHPGFWTFLEKISLVASSEQRDASHFQMGLKIRRARKSRYLANDRHIAEATRDFEIDQTEDRISRFLSRACHAVGGRHGIFAELGHNQAA